PAIGFTAIYAVLRFPNFTVASHATIGAFAGYVANTAGGLPAWAAVGVAFVVAGAAGVVTDEIVLQTLRPGSALNDGIGAGDLTMSPADCLLMPLRRAGAPPAAIAAVALPIVLENVVLFVWGNDLRGYDLPIR